MPHPISASPIESVLLVERIEPRLGRFEATSLPGHLVHVVMSGRVRQECNGRVYDLAPRSAIWYHEDELVRGECFEPWSFYSVNFIAPSLPPPEFAARLVRPPWTRTIACCRAMHAAWHDHALSAQRRELEVHAALNGLLACLASVSSAEPVRTDERSRLWWWLETEVRKRLDERLDMPALARLTGVSAATIERSCRHAVGLPPMRRLKRLRLSLAKGLLAREDLGIGEIAKLVGYDRVHEFSRDYRKFYGVPPSHGRPAGQARRAR